LIKAYKSTISPACLQQPFDLLIQQRDCLIQFPFFSKKEVEAAHYSNWWVEAGLTWASSASVRRFGRGPIAEALSCERGMPVVSAAEA
jgi:hypothetical protein